MKKSVIIEDIRGGITTGYTFADVAVGEIVTITAKDANGFPFDAVGVVVDFEQE